jgi:hypothetical protein
VGTAINPPIFTASAAFNRRRLNLVLQRSGARQIALSVGGVLLPTALCAAHTGNHLLPHRGVGPPFLGRSPSLLPVNRIGARRAHFGDHLFTGCWVSPSGLGGSTYLGSAGGVTERRPQFQAGSRIGPSSLGGFAYCCAPFRTGNGIGPSGLRCGTQSLAPFECRR